MTHTTMESTQKHVSESKGGLKPRKNRSSSPKRKDIQSENGAASDSVVVDDTQSTAVQERLTQTCDSDSQDSSSPAFAEPPSFGDVGDDLSEAEFSDLEGLNFDGNIDWPDGEVDDPTLLLSRASKNPAPLLGKAAAKLLLYQEENPSSKTVDPQTQARLEALLEAAGIGQLSTAEGKAFADPEVLRKLTSSVSCALDEAAAALTRMRAESQSALPHNDRTLAEACSDGDIEAVKRLLDEGRSVHETTEEGESLLSLACSAGYFELAEVLIRMKANVEDRGIKGDCTPLMEAASGGFVDIVRLLIAYNADVNAQSSAGHTALHHAAVGGYEDVVQMLIKAGANVEEQNENGHTPLMEAASAGHRGVAQLLLDAGAGINTHSNEFKESALTLACYKGHLEMVKFLLDAGADQEHKTDEMHTALMEASMDGHVEVARLLLDSGAQVNMPADSFESPLTLAACGGHVELANLLIERGANLEEVNDEGYTPLMEAAREGHEEMVALLLAHGANVNAQTEETQETALTLACCGGFLEVAHFLIRAHADIESGCSTPLMEAAQEGHLDLVRYLIKQKANVHAVTGTGDSALTYACENGHTDVADMLLQAGAKLEHESEGGRTPLMKAARAGHLCTVKFLISKGADVNRSTTNNDHTVLSLACAGGHLSVVELLLEKGADPMHKLKDGSTMLIEAAKGGHTNVVNLLLDYPQGLSKSTVSAASDYSDGIPMADGLSADLDQPMDGRKTTESLASRLEQFIHKMMSQAENSSGTKEEQMARKQEILEELQRVEQELKFRTQMAQLENQPLSSLDSQEDSPVPPPPTSLSSSPPSFLPPHEYVMNELQQKQMAIQEQQQHEKKLQQQKEFYQAKLQALKQQYQQKQLQLQQQRQRLISESANSSVESSNEPAKRQPIPLHIALQNHLHAHHVTEGNMNDLAQALQDWDTRDRNISLPVNQVKPMPAFNLSAKHEDDLDPPPPLPLEDLALTETPSSRPLADSLATYIHGKGNKSSCNFDTNLKRALELGTGDKLEKSTDYEMTMKTLEWLKTVDATCAPAELTAKKPPMTTSSSSQTSIMTVPRPIAKKNNELPDKTSATKITKVPNGYLDQVSQASRAVPAVPIPQRSISPSRAPFVDPNAVTDSNHDTALTLACAGGHAELVKLLLTRHAEIEHRDKKGFTPLILASTAGHAEVVEILIEHGADIEAQSERTKDTPLSLACSGGRYEVVEILLRLGANKEHRNVSDYTPLSLAASGGYVNIIKLLLSYGAEINSRTGSKLGISPLMLAAMNGHTAAVKLLLDMGSDINAQIETNRNTALTLACFQGRHDVVSLLVERKANIEHRAKTGLTPLMEAASGGYVDVGRVLLDKGADVNAPPVPSSKDTALTIAADKGHYRFVELLLARAASVDVKNKKGNSPLWLACNGGHLDVVQLLVSSSANIDTQDNRKVSALMAAFRKGHIKVVKWLVRHVTQFPSDKECARYITTVNDKELLRKCQSCMEIIVQAKDAQAKEAQKIAEFLLEEIETEKSREEKRKEAAARKREKKKQKRKEKQVEQQGTDSKGSAQDGDRKSAPTTEGSNDTASDQEEPEEDDDEEDDEEMLPPPPPPKREEKKERKQQSKQQQQPDKAPATVKQKDDTEGADKENASSRKGRKNKEKQSTNTSTTNSNRNQKSENSNNRGDKQSRKPPASYKVMPSSTGINDLDDFGENEILQKALAPAKTNVSNSRTISGSKRDRNSAMSGISQLDTFDTVVPVTSSNKYNSTPNKHQHTPQKSLVSPSPGKKKREEEWKEVIRKCKKIVIPSNAVQRLAKQLNAIREHSGAAMEFEKPNRKSGNRTLVISGQAEAMRHATNLVTVFLREQDKDIEGSQLSSKRSMSTASGTAGNQSNTASTANVPTNQADTMSSIGTFSIADFIVTSQNTASSETKPKPTQGKTVWQTRPSSSAQSAWGVPNVAAVIGSGSQSNMSPRVARANSAGKPPATAVAPPTQTKQPSDVSRQLFPEAKPPAAPVAAAAPSAGSAPVSSVAKPRQTVSQPVLPSNHAQASPPMQAKPPVQPPVAPPTTQSFAVRTPIARPAMPQQVPSPIQRPAMSYSPFEAQNSQQMHSGISSYGFPSSSADARPPVIDQSKAPGFRPSMSPMMMTSPFSPQQQANMNEDVYRAHSMGPASGVGINHSLMMSPLNNLSVATSVHHNLFAGNSGGGHHMQARLAMAGGGNGHMMDQQMGPDRDRYTTIDQPMTLPRIASSLNPNASEFTASGRFISENGNQPSPRTVQQTSPVDMRPSPPGTVYQPQARIGNALQSQGQHNVSPDQEMFNRGMMLPTSNSNALPAFMNQNFNHQMAIGSHQQHQQMLSNQGGIAMNQQTYSPRQQPVSSTDLITKLEESPPGNMAQGDTSESRSVRPIGVERSNRKMPTYETAIWGNSLTGPDEEWMSSGSGFNHPNLINNLFATGDTPMMPNFSAIQFYSGFAGGAGDNLQNTWLNSPSKNLQQDWPASSWNQTNTGN